MSWPRTIGIGAQRIVAMLGVTFLVPLLAGFPPTTTLFFSVIDTLLFFLVTVSHLPPYLGSSLAPIAPIIAVFRTLDMNYAQDGIITAGAILVLVGLITHFAGARWIGTLMPPAATGAVVALIGLNLAPAAWNNVKTTSLTTSIMIVPVCLITVLFKGTIGHLSILFGVLIGYRAAVVRNQVNFSAIPEAAWLGPPQSHVPASDPSTLGLFVPVIFVLVAEGAGHVKFVPAVTDKNFSDVTGHVLLADGIPTVLVGSGGGSGTTTYVENIGVMVAIRVYLTVAHVITAFAGLALSLLPKFDAIIATTSVGVLGGVGTVPYGTIGMLGVCIWTQDRVDFSNPMSFNIVAISLVVAIVSFIRNVGGIPFEGIVLGTGAVILIYHVMS